GGMGVVYKAVDTKLGRTVALKFLPPEMRHNEELKRRLTEEARAASALDHPNIVVIHDIDETPDGDLFIAMTFHEGATLRDRIAAGLTVPEALQIARQVASGLANSPRIKSLSGETAIDGDKAGWPVGSWAAAVQSPAKCRIRLV